MKRNSSRRYILAIDQGTTGSRAFLFDEKGRIVSSAYKEFTQYYPKPGWVEHDAEEIWKSVSEVIQTALKKSRISSRLIKAIGITNQRETIVLWNRSTGKPLAKAIVWQCRRTSEICKSLQGYKKKVHQKTGLVIDPYFSATKVKWLLDNVKGLRKKSLKGDVCFGTIDSWLIWKLTGGSAHVTDMTNASRTLLFNIRDMKWDKELLKIFKVPSQVLPSVQNSGSVFGKTAKLKVLPAGIPITGVLGDQQAALYGQGCFDAGNVKNTYGTGCFIMMNTGKKLVYSKKGLLSTVASDENGKPVYALEGAVFIAGAVMQWLRDELKVIQKASDSEAIVKSLKDTNGVYIVPAFTGLGAPYWDSEARGIICGLTRGANRKHLVRAALESICYQVKDVFDIMQQDIGRKIKLLNVDGGASRNAFLMQFQSDLLDTKIVRPQVIETTAQGAAYLAGRTIGIWKSKKQIRQLIKADKTFSSEMHPKKRTELYAGWRDAVKRAKSS